MTIDYNMFGNALNYEVKVGPHITCRSQYSLHYLLYNYTFYDLIMHLDTLSPVNAQEDIWILGAFQSEINKQTAVVANKLKSMEICG